NDNAKKYLTQELNRIQSDIKTFETKLETRYNEQLRIQQNLAATNNVTAEDVKPFIDTINNTKAIEVLAATDSEMRLRITAPLQYFTSSDFERYEKNISSAYNQRFMGGGEIAILRNILHKIFVTREYKLLVQGIIKLRINTGYYDTILSANAQAHELTDFTEFPNPHLYHHNCWSAARNEITKNLCEGNYELVVMQMVAAVQSVNVAEHASFVNGLLDDIKNSNLVRTKGLFHVIDSTGKHYTYAEIIAHETALQREDAVKAAKATLTNNPKEGYSQIEIPDDDANWEEENE
ncbi:MAG: hypothetical protein IJ272_07425, partial [Clostridia bacterium]|nr:hypothetical protein [Clostridia bacterium]